MPATALPSSTRSGRRGIALRAFAALSLLAATAFDAPAQSYPSKPVMLVVPFVAGGATDALARILAQDLAIQLGQNVIVENRAGAAGGIGASAVARSEPDGHTLLLGTVSTHAINPALYPSLSYDPVKDYAPIAYLAGVANVLVVTPKRIAAGTVQAFVQEARDASPPLTFASSGAGSSIHLSGEMFKSATGVDMTHVPYRGSGPALNDLIGGQVALMFDNLPSALGQIMAGSVRALAVTSPQRSSLLPDVPTFAESGIAGVEAVSWFALFAPAATPAPVVARLRQGVAASLAKAEVKARFAALGAEPRSMNPDELSSFLRTEIAAWASVVARSGAKAN